MSMANILCPFKGINEHYRVVDITTVSFVTGVRKLIVYGLDESMGDQATDVIWLDWKTSPLSVVETRKP